MTPTIYYNYHNHNHHQQFTLLLIVILLLVSCCCLVSHALTTRHVDYITTTKTTSLANHATHPSYNEFKVRYRDSIEAMMRLPGQDEMRARIYEQTISLIEAHNARPDRSHDLEVNHLADWTRDELDTLIGYKASSDNHGQGEHIPTISGHDFERLIPGFLTDELPEEKDWRKEEGVVGPVGDQGLCGSCWAFSIVGMLEGQERKLNSSLRKIVQLSQQQLVDCNLEDRGCGGGRFLTALGYIERAGGLQTFRDYPYVSLNRTQGKCKFDETKAFPSTKYLNGTYRLDPGDEQLLKRTVAFYGPVSVAVDSNHTEFRQYMKGIHYNPNCTQSYTHSVLLVGYGTSSSGQDYWIVRNSWGKRWGMAGYIFMARNVNNNCGIASNPVISLANFPTTSQ